MSIISITNPALDKSTHFISQDIDSDVDMSSNSSENEEEKEASDELSELMNKEQHQASKLQNNQLILTPGELITEDPMWMRGHGTYYLDDFTFSSISGTILKVDKLLSVEPFMGKYQPETGDHVIGRIVGTQNKRWKVEIGGEHLGVLMLGAVNLPGGLLRRKSDSDELQMRAILKEGDLLNCEVQSLFNDGAASLHTRSLKYGKLRNGLFIKVEPKLIIRTKNHMHDLPGGVSVILGVNGYCWVYKTTIKSASANTSTNTSSAASMESKLAQKNNSNGYSIGMGSISITRLEEESSWDIYSDKNDQINDNIKETISRYRNCLKILNFCNISINVTRLVKCYEISLGFGNINNLVSEEVMKSIGDQLIQDEKMRG